MSELEANESVALDATDIRILDQLQSDASLSNDALAKRVHVSPATCLRRVKRLVQRGVIERRVALLAPHRLGPGLTVIAEVTLDRQGAEHLAAFEARAIAERPVQQCYRVSPGPDFVLVLHVPDMGGWHVLVQRLFTQDANVRNVKAYFSVHRSKFEPAIALPRVPAATAPRRAVSAASPRAPSGTRPRESATSSDGPARRPAAAG